MDDEKRFMNEFRVLYEKVDSRYQIALNMIGFLNARFSNVPTEGLKKGSIVTHTDNQFPSIFQYSQVLITKFRRTGLEGSHICEGIIINKPSEISNDMDVMDCINSEEEYDTDEDEMESDEEEDEMESDENENVDNGIYTDDESEKE